MHPRIAYLTQLIKDIPFEKSTEVNTLSFLKKHGATMTEAIISLSLGYNVDMEVIENLIFNSNVWTPEGLEETLFQTLKYMYHDINDPNYEEKDNSVQVSI